MQNYYPQTQKPINKNKLQQLRINQLLPYQLHYALQSCLAVGLVGENTNNGLDDTVPGW